MWREKLCSMCRSDLITAGLKKKNYILLYFLFLDRLVDIYVAKAVRSCIRSWKAWQTMCGTTLLTLCFVCSGSVGWARARTGSSLLSAFPWLFSFSPAQSLQHPPGSAVLSPCSSHKNQDTYRTHSVYCKCNVIHFRKDLLRGCM